jgi:predicted nucleic acid-binding protein
VKKAGELPTAFWDSSALVPLCIQESTSRQVRSHLRKLAPVVWWASPVEVYSAVARLRRSGAVNEMEKQGALNRLALLRRGWREILPDDALRELAGRLLDLYPLRASDSLQLAGPMRRASTENTIGATRPVNKARPRRHQPPAP